MNSQNGYVSSEGVFLPRPGVSAIFLLKHRDKMKYIEEFINNSILGLYYAPVPSKIYNITIFDIWKSKEPLTKLQLHRLQELSKDDSDRYDQLLEQVSKRPDLAINVLVKDLATADHFLQSKIPMETTVICNELFYDDSIFLNITWLDPKMGDYIKTVTSNLSTIFQTSGSVYSIGIMLGYKYKVIDEKHEELVSYEINRLGKIINIFDFTMIIEQPRIASYSKVSNCKIFN